MPRGCTCGDTISLPPAVHVGVLAAAAALFSAAWGALALVRGYARIVVIPAFAASLLVTPLGFVVVVTPCMEGDTLILVRNPMLPDGWTRWIAPDDPICDLYGC